MKMEVVIIDVVKLEDSDDLLVVVVVFICLFCDLIWEVVEMKYFIFFIEIFNVIICSYNF